VKFSDLIEVDLDKLGTAATDWKRMVGDLETLADDAHDGMKAKSDSARWAGVNATVTRSFVDKTAKEFRDLHAEAKSIWSVLRDAHSELKYVQSKAKSIAADARKGDPARQPPDPGLLVTDGPKGTVRVMEAMCTAEGPTQRTKDLIEWYADTLTGLLAHASEIDVAIARALKKAHGGDPHDAGHAKYTSLDEDQLPRATKLASLGDDANPKQRAELRRLWQSLSPDARAELWKGHKDDLLAAGLLSPSVKKIAPDKGSGPYNVESPGWEERLTREKMRLITEGADWMDSTDASRHMAHYLGNSGDDMDLPVDKMMSDDDAFKKHIDASIRQEQDAWREKALEEFEKNGGQPVSIPVETKNRDYSFDQNTQENWFYAVGSTRSNVTGVVTVTPGSDGEPQVGLDYQANAWDRYNWDQGKGVTIGSMEVPDGQMARLHTTGLAQEFDMSGSSSTKHYDLGGSSPNKDPLPDPAEPGREGGRTDPGRENAYR
jgi:hypothetical protein